MSRDFRGGRQVRSIPLWTAVVLFLLLMSSSFHDLMTFFHLDQGAVVK